MCLVTFLSASQDPTSRPTTVASRPVPHAPSPIAGMWQLRNVVGQKLGVAPAFRGYLAVGEHYLSLHLVGPGVEPKIPFFQSGFRTYRLERDRLITTTLIGVANRENGDVVIEDNQVEEVRSWERTGSTLRIKKGVGEYLEFTKLE